MRWRPLWVRFTLSAAFFLRLLLPLRSLLGCVVGEGDVVGVVSFSPSSSSSMPPCSCCACESSCAAFSFFLVSFNCARTSSTSSRAFATEASSAFFSSPQLSLALLSSSRSLSSLYHRRHHHRQNDTSWSWRSYRTQPDRVDSVTSRFASSRVSLYAAHTRETTMLVGIVSIDNGIENECTLE